MNHNEIEKSKIYIVAEMINYLSNSVVSKTILKTTTCSINAMSFDAGETLIEKIMPFDAFVQIIEGKAEIIIDGATFFMEKGETIILPAHKPNVLRANERFKMILTIIKSGYE